MSTKIKINVTKEVLQKSAYCVGGTNTTNCAIALAIRDIFPESAVGSTAIYFDIDGREDIIKSELPSIAKRFIKVFDQSSPYWRLQMNPVSFEIDIPDEVIDSISIKEITERLKECNTVELV